ncbi:MAG: hypothetical protein AAFV29_17935, partial [Myxococcota bacterium]
MLIAWGLALIAADGISIDLGDIDFSPTSRPALCWLGPKKMSAKTRRQLTKAMDHAALATRPSRLQWPIKQMRLHRKDSEQCRRQFVRIYVRNRGRVAHFSLGIKTDENSDFEIIQRWTSSWRALDGRGFERGWSEVWARLKPPPPPITQPTTQYVDADLAAEQVVAAPPPPPVSPRSPALLSAWVEGGWMGRRLIDAPGDAQSAASVATAGFRLTLHSAGLLGRHAPHVDLTGRYHRRFVSATQDGASIGVSADQWSVDATGWWTFASALRIGPMLGYELTRFESEARSVLSTRFSVIRFGGAAVYPLWKWSDRGQLS